MATLHPTPKELERTSSLLEALARLDPAGRLAIYRCGALTRAECALWAAWHPDEPPLVNDE